MKNIFKKSSSNKKDNGKSKEQPQKIRRVDTILETIETEDIAGMLKFILNEEPEEQIEETINKEK